MISCRSLQACGCNWEENGQSADVLLLSHVSLPGTVNMAIDLVCTAYVARVRIPSRSERHVTRKTHKFHTNRIVCTLGKLGTANWLTLFRPRVILLLGASPQRIPNPGLRRRILDDFGRSW
jgi:hypothetical protein